MLKKLSEAKLQEILETGISEFAAHGPDKANINVIAKKSGVSVGVLYKYYDGKEGFFKACLKQALRALEAAIEEAIQGDDKILVRAEKLIRAIQRSAKENPNYNVLYHEITAGSSQRHAATLAAEIEGISSRAYVGFIAKAQEDGDIRKDINPRLFAFFFDNMLTMLQFSYSCEYYRERFKIYCGEEMLADDERVVQELLKFFESAFTTEQSQIPHKR
ncbi:TetR/AcrR family transcriptional regulator [Fusibacter paucivorans]|uniref:TetR/AcrR family transcriptional regulator n=1 Tax=Fusibacter paucivorans TaxID=76009 RepID=A0ABS5PP70_9FIRM|nr:TetR/AcrR family transcriptional regulator [Fusibacter paucivorans]MBS7526146.1 TetR/AcrR family transcriptional regulator [Fusibacter paucivorans]